MPFPSPSAGTYSLSLAFTANRFPLYFQIQNAVKEGFVYDENKNILIVANDCETLLNKLQERASNKEKAHKILPNV